MVSSQWSWGGASDLSRKIPGEYFIPKSLQTDFGSLLPFLGTFVSETRTERLERVSKARSRFVVPVFENTHHSHNISAILRTADALGFQDAIFCYTQNDMRFRLKDSVERGSSDWLSPRRAESVDQCARALQASGFCRLAVSLPSFERTAEHYRQTLPSFSAEDLPGAKFEEFRAGRKIALIFGNELHGVSQEWTTHADGYVHVDMHGFVESLNVSVCAGILLHSLRCSLEANEPGFRISEDESRLLLEHWMARSVTRSAELVGVHRPALWPYFDFVRKGLFFDPFHNLHERKAKL